MARGDIAETRRVDEFWQIGGELSLAARISPSIFVLSGEHLMRRRITQDVGGLRIVLLVAALAMGALINSFAEAQTNTRGPKVKLKENDGRENETYLYKESWALVIGVSNYEHWPELPGVEKDVERVRNALEKHGFKIQYL